MTDTKISAMPPASLPLTSEAVPCVQGGVNVQAPAAAFGIPVVSATAPTPLAQYQTWIDLSTSPSTLRMYIGTSWSALYTIDTSGALTLAQPLALSADPTSSNQAATKQYVDSSTHVGTLLYQGAKDCSASPNYPSASQGHYYVVSVAGKIGGASGVSVGVGDGLLCRTDNAGGTQGAVGTSWNIVQGHDNAVVGPASSVDGRFAFFNGTTGKLIKDGGVAFDVDATMTANSDLRVPSQKAVRSSIGGLAIGTDTLQQGQGWLWDALTSTFRARSNEGLNFLANSAFDVWQENTSYSLSNTAAKTHVADFWKAGVPATGRTVSRTAGIANSLYALKLQRAAGGTSTSKCALAQQLGTAESMFLAGKTVTVSFDYLAGSNYSPTAGPLVIIYYGTGLEEDIDIHAASPAFATGGNAVAVSVLSQVAPIGTVARIVASGMAIPAGVTEIALAIYVGNYIGTAGADDSCTIGSVKLELGNVATHYRKPSLADELLRCQRRYMKTFLQGTVPVQSAGAATGEHRAPATKAGANVQSLGTMRFPVMRAAPAVTLFNPAAANAQARDITAAADCSATAAQNVSESSFEVVATGNASTAVGNTLGIHAVADARL